MTKPGAPALFRRSAIRLTILMTVLAFQGCAPTSRAPWFAVTKLPSEPVTMSRLYIYSFLDLRTDYMGRRMVNDISRQLVTRLANHGIATELHSFANDPLAANFARVQGSEEIPVGQVIIGNAAREKRFAPDHRLIVFPVYTKVLPNRRAYFIRWTITNARTGQEVWSATSRSRNGENAAAQVVVDSLISQMTAAGLFRRPDERHAAARLNQRAATSFVPAPSLK
jgi:hypothetical protein